jgi:hypothetical protein
LPDHNNSKSFQYYFIHFRCEEQEGLKSKTVSIRVEKRLNESRVDRSLFMPLPPFLIRNKTDKQCLLSQVDDKVEKNIIQIPKLSEVEFALFSHSLPPKLHIEIIKELSSEVNRKDRCLPIFY